MTDDISKKDVVVSDIVLRGKRVETDAAGNVCLNDLWNLAGKPENRRSRDWYRSKRAKALSGALADRIVEILHKPRKEVEETIYYTAGRGGGTRTYAHPVLALDYAEYLEPEIGVEVREIFIRFKSHDVLLAMEILQELAQQADYDATRVELRNLVKEHNKLSAGVAQGAGVRNFEAYNGQGLMGLYEMTRAQLLKHKGLPEDANHLDHAGHEELAANHFKATQAIAKIRRENISGQKACEAVHLEVGSKVRHAIAELGGTMPENEPALEHIKEAEKRLKLTSPKSPEKLPSRPDRKPKPT